MTDNPQPISTYQLNTNAKKIYAVFFIVKLAILILVAIQGALIFKKFLFNPKLSGFAFLFLSADVLILAAILFMLFMLIPRYGSALSPLKAITYSITLNNNSLVIKESRWANDFIIPIKNIAAITYNGQLIFMGQGINKKFKLNEKGQPATISPEFMEELVEIYPGTELYYYRLNLAFMDNYRDLKEKLITFNHDIRLYEPIVKWDDEVENEED